MNIINWAQFLTGTGFLLVGLVMFILEVVGTFKFKYVLNRMHAAAVGDTLGIGISLTGLIILSGFNVTSVKLALVILFLWLASPVSSHLIARLEVTTNENLEENCDMVVIEKEETDGIV